jgi:O-antigen ligase
MSLPLLAFTNSRSSLLTVVVFLILYILIVVLPRKPLLSFLFFIAGIYGVIFTYNNLMKGTFIEQKLETTGKSGSDDDRIYIVQAAASVFMSNPIMGVGAGNYVKHNKKGLYTHNDFFEVATTLGIIGLILYYSMYFILFKKLKRLYQISKDRKQKDKIKVMVCSLIALLILSNFIVIFPDMLFMSYVFCISLLITHELKLLNFPNSQICVA